MTFTVIDTIESKSSWIHRYPELAAWGEGVLAILDPVQIQVAPEVDGCSVTICRPDGSITKVVAARAIARHSVVAVFFKGPSIEDVPNGAELMWE
jgi:hypothetical protein